MSVSVGVERGSVFGLAFAGLTAAFEGWRARRREITRLTRELESCSDRELADIGLSRSDIPDVARGTFRAA